ncbi:hypothetical protein ABHI18_001588 [Aspergillus niger]
MISRTSLATQELGEGGEQYDPLFLAEPSDLGQPLLHSSARSSSSIVTKRSG